MFNSTDGLVPTAGMNVQDLTQTLVQSFNLLANEVQNLNDRQVVLEHKLRYAHEQVRLHTILPNPESHRGIPLQRSTRMMNTLALDQEPPT